MLVRFWAHTNDIEVASFRVRCFHIVSELRSLGLNIGFYKDGEQPDVLVLLKRYDETTLSKVRDLKASGTYVVLDLCDNHFYMDFESEALKNRADRLRRMCGEVDHITTASSYMKDYIKQNIFEEIPIDVVDDYVEVNTDGMPKERLFTRLRARLRYKKYLRQLISYSEKYSRVVWFGSHGSPGVHGGMSDLMRVISAMNIEHRENKIVLTIISNSEEQYNIIRSKCDFPVLYLEWSNSTAYSAIEEQDISLIPITLTPFTMAKSANRAITSITYGLPVVADELPSYVGLDQSVVIGDLSSDFQSLYHRAKGKLPEFRPEKRNINTLNSWLDLFYQVRGDA
ncbi:hypothetical protein [uncultured Thalassolituus sp.]|uniref:hypothetical protein n=1 Tax=uncultured Thalassolituus sp. TaxID=285273 RepID=UPI002616CEF9|nr:hypothetical protein [uncultured Thalassolituus sp.]